MLNVLAKGKAAGIFVLTALILLFVGDAVLGQAVYADSTAAITVNSREELDQYVYDQFAKHIKNRTNESTDGNGYPVTTLELKIDVKNLPENEKFIIENSSIINPAECFKPANILNAAVADIYLNDYEYLIMKDLSERISVEAAQNGGHYTKFILNITLNIRWGESKAQTAAVEAYCSSVVSSVTDSEMSKYEKALAIHDFMVKEFAYATKDMMSDPNIYYPWFIIQGEKRGVCQAYTALYHRMLLKAGFTSDELRVIRHDSASGEEKHTWNLIKLDGSWYHVDVTWDDPMNVDILSHDYFLKSDQTMKNNSHTWNYSLYPKSDRDYTLSPSSSSVPSSSTVSSSPVSGTASSEPVSSTEPTPSSAASSYPSVVSSSVTPVSSSQSDPISSPGGNSSLSVSSSVSEVLSSVQPVSSGAVSESDSSSTGSEAGTVTSVPGQPPSDADSSFSSVDAVSSKENISIGSVLAYSLIPAAAVILTAVLVIYAVKSKSRK